MENLTQDQMQTLQRIIPLATSLMAFLEEAMQAKTPRMTSIVLDDGHVLLKLWASHKYLSPFQRIEALVTQSSYQKQLLLKCLEVIEKQNADGNFELIADISQALNEF
jgi:hypothetical protein